MPPPKDAAASHQRALAAALMAANRRPRPGQPATAAVRPARPAGLPAMGAPESPPGAREPPLRCIARSRRLPCCRRLDKPRGRDAPRDGAGCWPVPWRSLPPNAKQVSAARSNSGRRMSIAPASRHRASGSATSGRTRCAVVIAARDDKDGHAPSCSARPESSRDSTHATTRPEHGKRLVLTETGWGGCSLVGVIPPAPAGRV